MGKAMTFVVIAWLSVVLVFSAWTIAQSGRYILVDLESITRLLDTHTGTTYEFRGPIRGYEVRFVVRRLIYVKGDADYGREQSDSTEWPMGA